MQLRLQCRIFGEAAPSLGEAQITVRAAAHDIGIGISLAVVLPATNLADLEAARIGQGG
ncbi:hypothetical protein J2W22_000817 [Sphingomonas kyeonggiensis]|nr:hypothetical protein [Sphingomonas kyeonggiensis]MDQ0248770.1 hypothetical protein [Sphingomonas kyeonggiensis]